MRFGAIASWTAGGQQMVSVSLPAMNEEQSEETMRDMGRLGSHTMGHYWTLDTTHYVWYTHNSWGFDPGTFDDSLSGMTGIEVTLPAGNRTAAQVASSSAAAINANGTFTASTSGSIVDIVGTQTASAGSTTFDTAGEKGILGMQYSDFSALAYFDAAVLRGARLDPTELPTNTFIVTGMKIFLGTTHSDQVPVALYQGGTSDDFEGAEFLGVCGVTTGSAVASTHYGPAPAPFAVDPNSGSLWVTWMHDAGEATMPFPALASAAATTSNYATTSGGQGIVITAAGTASSNPDNFPATMPAIGGGAFATFPSIGICFVQSSSFQNDMRVVGRIGTRELDGSAFPQTSDNTLLVGNSFTTPETLDMTVLDASVNYDTHFATSHYRVSLAVGGLGFDDFTSASFSDIGLADGTNTGWVDVVPSGTVNIPSSSRIFLTIHHTEPGTSASVLAFDSSGPNVYGPEENPAAYYNGNTSESEADDGSLGGVASTNVNFDENIAQSGIVAPNGDIYTNNNNVGVRMRYVIDGFAVL